MKFYLTPNSFTLAKKGNTSINRFLFFESGSFLIISPFQKCISALHARKGHTVHDLLLSQNVYDQNRDQ